MAATRGCLLSLAILLSVGAVVGQQKEPTPPSPAKGVQSLDAALKFVEDKLSAVGPINYTVHFRDKSGVQDLTDRYKN
jgi:hypothetical protein